MAPWLRDFIDNPVFGPHHRWWALWVVVVSVFIATTDVGMLTTSLPVVIITGFRTDVTFAGWIVFVYALVTGALYLPCGRRSTSSDASSPSLRASWSTARLPPQRVCPTDRPS